MSSDTSLSFKILLAGNNPNILFYTSRFQLGKNIDLYHVSDSKSNIFNIETKTYGSQQLEIENHFTSIENLTEALGASQELKDLKFDLIIVSTKSLKELSSLPNVLKPITNNDTKIFIESSGFIQLESFLKNSKDLNNLDIFSIMTDYDIRQIANNQFKQFSSNENNGNKCNIYIGGKISAGPTKKKKTLLLKDSSKYSSDTIKVLATLETLFQKLFPSDTISNCHKSYNEFLSTQWNLAISRICLDPLSIIFEETDSKKLVDEVLAKPLISGIITEIITIAKSMNIKLDGKIDNENKLIKNWLNEYNNNKIPALLYNFIHRTSDLNLDLLILQPILLADDHDIKTPYLEFLYTMMCQMEKLNQDTSEWFIRAENLQSYKEHIASITTSRNQYNTECKNLSLDLAQKEKELENLKISSGELRNELASKEEEISNLKDEFEIILESKNKGSTQLQNGNISLNQTKTQERNLINISTVNNKKKDEDGEEDFKAISEQSLEVAEGDSSILANSSTIEIEKSLALREKELKKKEQELKERQEAFDKTIASQQVRSPQFQSPLQHPIQLQTSPALYQKNGTFPYQPPMHNLPHIRTMAPPDKSSPVFGPHSNNKSNSSTPTLNANKFVDPISSGNMDLNSPFDVSELRHPIVPTNRKNRKNRNTTIGNASSTSIGSFGNQVPNNNYNSDRSFSGSSNLMNTSGNSLNMMRSKQNAALDMPRTTKLNTSGVSSGLLTPNNVNTSMTSKNTSQDDSMTATNDTSFGKPVMKFGLGINSQTSLTTPLDKTTIPVNIEPIHFNGSGNVSREILNDISDNNIDINEEEPAKDKKKSKKKFGLFGKKKK